MKKREKGWQSFAKDEEEGKGWTLLVAKIVKIVFGPSQRA